jgi:hypothetical protein
VTALLHYYLAACSMQLTMYIYIYVCIYIYAVTGLVRLACSKLRRARRRRPAEQGCHYVERRATCSKLHIALRSFEHVALMPLPAATELQQRLQQRLQQSSTQLRACCAVLLRAATEQQQLRYAASSFAEQCEGLAGFQVYIATAA